MQEKHICWKGELINQTLGIKLSGPLSVPQNQSWSVTIISETAFDQNNMIQKWYGKTGPTGSEALCTSFSCKSDISMKPIVMRAYLSKNPIL